MMSVCMYNNCTFLNVTSSRQPMSFLMPKCVGQAIVKRYVTKIYNLHLNYVSFLLRRDIINTRLVLLFPTAPPGNVGLSRPLRPRCRALQAGAPFSRLARLLWDAVCCRLPPPLVTGDKQNHDTGHGSSHSLICFGAPSS